MSTNSVGDDYDENQHAIESYDEDDSSHHYPDLHARDREADDRAALDDTFLQPLFVTEPTLYQLACRFAKVYRDLARNSDQQFLPTPVTRLPTGKETGRYLAIDVGGSNLRVAFIDLLGEAADGDESGSNTPPGRLAKEMLLRPRRHRVRRTLEKAWPIGEHLKNDKAEDLFLWIGDCMAEVVADSLSGDSTNGAAIPEELEMGITFSFPMM
jgi:hexokinase